MFDAISAISPIEQYCIHENWRVQLEGGVVYFVMNSSNFSHSVSSSVNATKCYCKKSLCTFIKEGTSSTSYKLNLKVSSFGPMKHSPYVTKNVQFRIRLTSYIIRQRKGCQKRSQKSTCFGKS